MGAIVAVVGLGLVAVGAWLLASGFGPTELLPGRVTEVTSTTNRHVTSYLIDVAWSGGSGSIESSDLYAALFPLDGETAVTLERSTLTGAVVAIELGGRSYRDENLSVTLDGGTVAVGLLMVVIGALLAFRRVPLSAARTWRLEQATIVAIAVAGVGVGLWMIAYGANGLWVAFGPRTTVTATLLDAANSYVDLAWAARRDASRYGPGVRHRDRPGDQPGARPGGDAGPERRGQQRRPVGPARARRGPGTTLARTRSTSSCPSAAGSSSSAASARPRSTSSGRPARARRPPGRADREPRVAGKRRPPCSYR